MSVVLPPNSTGSTVATLTSGGFEFQKNILSDGVTPTQLASILLPGAAESLEIASQRVSSHTLDGNKTTYVSATSARSPGTAATTAIAQLIGSATKTMRLTRVLISFTEATAVAVYNVKLVKTSAAATGGTASTETVLPMDSADAAGTGVAKFFTVTPTAGTLVGVIAVAKLYGSITATFTTVDRIEWNFGRAGAKCPVLRGVAETLEINIGSATPANAGAWDIAWEWTEE